MVLSAPNWLGSYVILIRRKCSRSSGSSEVGYRSLTGFHSMAGWFCYRSLSEDEQQRGITMKSSAISLLHTKEDRPRLRRLQMEEAARAAQAATTTTTASTSASLPTPPSQPPPSTPMPPAPPEGTGPSTQGAGE